MTGLLLAQYRIDAELGRGGMGIVYRATDTKLGRTVALKILPVAALSSEDDRARFFREAQAAAQLSHPNIAGVHQIDEAIPVDDEGRPVGASDGPRPFIAMEFIEGETLAARVKRGPFALREAVAVAGQVAEALKAAHAKNIVHRDIKSANVMLTPEGVAKVLDFGLAKTNQSTMLTRMGSTLGTVAYMSPEQARGNEVDGRSDLYSLGTMLYEMVAGRLPFAGDYEQAVLYSILNEPPEPLTAVRTGVPMELERITAKLLSKEAEYRYQTAADLIADLKALDVSGSGVSRRSMAAVGAGTAVSASPKAAFPNWLGASIVVAALVLGGGAAWLLKPSGTSTTGITASITTRIDVEGVVYSQGIRVSNDGRYAAFVGRLGESAARSVILVDLEEGTRRVFPDARPYTQATFSPDGRWLVYGVSGATMKVPTASGSPVPFGPECFYPIFLDAGTVACEVHADRTVVSVPLDGGEPRVLFAADSIEGVARVVPVQSLEDGRRFLGILRAENEGKRIEEVALFDAREQSWEVLLSDASMPRYVEPGYLTYIQGSEWSGIFMARPFDLSSGTFTGPAVPVREQPVSWNEYHVTQTGALIEVSDGGTGNLERRLAWFDLDGNLLGYLDLPPSVYADPAFSPDGRWMVVTQGVAGNEDETDLLLIDTQTGNDARFTFTKSANRGRFSPDGRRVYFESDFESRSRVLMVKPLDGSEPEAPARPLLDDVRGVTLSATNDLFAYQNTAGGGSDIVVRSFADSTIHRVIYREGNQFRPALSSDGALVAYSSIPEEGGLRLYVQQTLGDGFWTVSAPDGVDPFRATWSVDGQWLYFNDGGELWRVRVRREPMFQMDRAERVATLSSRYVDFALHPDGRRVLVVLSDDDQVAEIAEATRLSLRINLATLLDRIAPADR